MSCVNCDLYTFFLFGQCCCLFLILCRLLRRFLCCLLLNDLCPLLCCLLSCFLILCDHFIIFAPHTKNTKHHTKDQNFPYLFHTYPSFVSIYGSTTFNSPVTESITYPEIFTSFGISGCFRSISTESLTELSTQSKPSNHVSKSTPQ